MGEYLPAKIWLGGDLPRSLLPDLMDALDGLGIEEYESLVDEEPLEDYLARKSGDTENPWFGDAQANYGDFPGLKKFCQDHNLSYDVQADPHHEFGGFWLSWRPGRDEWERGADADGTVMLGLYSVRDAWEATKSRSRAQGGAATIDALMADFDRWLAANTPPELPPFRIVDDPVEAPGPG